MKLPYSTSEMEQYIRQAAIARGIDPDTAVRVAKSEGLAKGVWQSNYKKGSKREPSYGPFQLLVGGKGTGFPIGMGNAFKKQTGLDPSKPENAFAAVDYALDRAVEDGWSAWYGAKKIGVTGKKGISPDAKPLGVSGRQNAGVGAGLSKFMGKTEADAAFANLMAGQPGIPSAPGIFDTYLALDNMNVTAAPIPAAKPENPANRQFSDGAVGPLSQRDYGYQTARTVEDLRRALGGPEPDTPRAIATAIAGTTQPQNATGAADLGGLFSAQPAQSFAAVAPSESENLGLFDPMGPQTQETFQTGPSQRLGPRGAPPAPATAQSRFDQAFGLFDAPVESVATSNALPEVPGVQVVPSQSEPPTQPPASPLQPLSPPQTVAPRTVAPPQPSRPTYQNNVIPNAAQSVQDNVNQYDLPNEDGYSYGYSPWGSGVARVYDNADERTKTAATGPGLFGAFNKEFGTNIGLGPGKTLSPLAAALGAGAATIGAGPFAMAIPAANMFGATNWLADRMDVVPKEQRVPVQQPQQQQSFMTRLFGGNPLQGFAGGLFDQAPQAAGGLFGGGREVSFNGPIGRNERDVNLSDLTQEARNELDRATRGLY